MSTVTHLHRNATDRSAEVGRAPRPLLPATAQSTASARATALELRPSAVDPTGTDTVARPTRGTRTPDDSALDGSRAAAEAELAHRISGIARSVAQGALEVLAGTRPLQQMGRWLDPENYERLQLRANLVRCISTAPNVQRGSLPVATHRHVVVRSARVCPVSPGVYEASVVAFDQRRVRAVALRIEQRRGTWRVTALEIG